MMVKERIQELNSKPIQRGDYVLYWMQQSQRLHWNHAFAIAVDYANKLGLPLLVGFGLTPSFPQANLRHYAFMLEGLAEVEREVEQLGARWHLGIGSPDDVCLELAQRAAIVVTDRGYLRIQRRWRQRVAQEAPCALIQVETDVVVPVEVVTAKEEYAARTLRPKIWKHIEKFLEPVKVAPLRVRESLAERKLNSPTERRVDWKRLLDELPVDRSVTPSNCFLGGTRAALERFEHFLSTHYSPYSVLRSDPGFDVTSGMSPYLHFGQISPVYLAYRVYQMPPSPSRDAFFEELIVRRELSMNFVFYNDQYDSYEAIPAWARTTLAQHAHDPRPHIYTLEELETASTYDPFWNAAQTELVATGYMHNYMRMYWGKKIIEWTTSPEQAFEFALYLNNKYELDGRDPNSFAGVAWCFGKHDRPWPEHMIFGTVRTMSASGLQRKANMNGYLKRVARLAEQMKEKDHDLFK